MPSATISLPTVTDDLSRKVTEWLTKTGYPFEMRVAQAAREANPLWVDQSRNYFDAVTEKVRETDVVVAWGLRQAPGKVVVLLTIECKSKPAPWVVFDDGQLPTIDDEWQLAEAVRRSANDAYGDSRSISIRPKAFTGNTLLKPSIVGSAAVEVTFGKAPERNGAWDAVRAAVSAAHGIIAEFDAQQLEDGNRGLVAFPVVVTSGRLFRSYLNGVDIQLEEAERLEVRMRMGASLDETRCFILTEAALPQLFAEAAKTSAVLSVGDQSGAGGVPIL